MLETEEKGDLVSDVIAGSRLYWLDFSGCVASGQATLSHLHYWCDAGWSINTAEIKQPLSRELIIHLHQEWHTFVDRDEFVRLDKRLENEVH